VAVEVEEIEAEECQLAVPQEANGRRYPSDIIIDIRIVEYLRPAPWASVTGRGDPVEICNLTTLRGAKLLKVATSRKGSAISGVT
jgi:hypothetical protein